MNYVLIGDIHSQAKNLERALWYVQKNIQDAKVIFLGDLFDSKNGYSDSYRVYELVREAELNLKATVLQSNHQDKLIRYLKGNRMELNNGLDKTISDFIRNSLSSDELFNWLIRQPYGIVFRDTFDVEFRCAHAYFSDAVHVPSYTDQYYVRALNRDHKHQFLYGLQDDKKNRIHWWDQNQESQNYIRAAGHYKIVQINYETKSIVLDSCCGDLSGVLSIYDVNSRKLHQF